MRFIIPINEAKDGESQTCHCIETHTRNARSNKKYLRMYFKDQGVPVQRIKTVMKEMGFWGERLGDSTSNNRNH